MNDYYKILGMKETATMDEIRDRWIELMRELHPDQAKKLREEDQERVKQINEAYQVLKHSSTRVEYDLKRSFGPKEKKISRRKVVIPMVTCAAFIVVGLILFGQRHQLPSSKPLIPPIPDAKTSGREDSGKNGLASSQVQVSAAIEKIVPPPRPEAVQQSSKVRSVKNTNADHSAGTRFRSGRSSIKTPLNEPQPSTAKVVKGEPAPKPAEPETETAILTAQQMKQPLLEITEGPSSSGTKTQNTALVKTTAPNPQETKEVISKVEPAPKSEQRANKVLPIDLAPKKSVIYHPTLQYSFFTGERRFEPAKQNTLVSEEGEVREFFNNYRDSYVQRDIIGFLHHFSEKAIQNQKYKIDDIRRVYATFLDQSQQLLYYVEELSMEIYQNAVEVNARYKVDQTLKNGEKNVLKGPIRWVLGREDGALKVVVLDYKNIN